MIQYVRDQGLGGGPLEIYAAGELRHGADRILDTMIYYVVRGYEQGMRAQSLGVAMPAVFIYTGTRHGRLPWNAVIF